MTPTRTGAVAQPFGNWGAKSTAGAADPGVPSAGCLARLRVSVDQTSGLTGACGLTTIPKLLRFQGRGGLGDPAVALTVAAWPDGIDGALEMVSA